MHNLESELKESLKYIEANWSMQNNFYDYKSNFIYKVEKLNEVIDLSKQNGIDCQYAIHRWYNFHTSIQCERIFVEFGAEKESDLKNKEIDIYIDSIPFDVKLTVYPNALKNHPFDLNTRDGKNEMIKWMYSHQSQQQRKHLANRLFIVCDGKTQFDSLALKSDFSQIRKKISKYIDCVKNEGFNEINICDNGVTYKVFSDIIYVTE